MTVVTEQRRFYGYGTIEPRRGRYRVRVVIDGRYRDLDTCDTREDAESLLRGYAVLAAAGEVVTHGETLRDYGARWLDQRELAGGKNTKTFREPAKTPEKSSLQSGPSPRSTKRSNIWKKKRPFSLIRLRH